MLTLMQLCGIRVNVLIVTFGIKSIISILNQLIKILILIFKMIGCFLR
jgi:hypothetical protein